MSRAPLATPHPKSAILFVVATSDTGNAEPISQTPLSHYQSVFENFIELPNLSVSPWLDPMIEQALESAPKGQCLILSERLSAYISLLATHLLELGRDVFVICETYRPKDDLPIRRLTHSGCVVFSNQDFLDTLAYVSAPDMSPPMKGPHYDPH